MDAIIPKILMIILLAYLVGGLPTAYLLALFVRRINVFELGSGNMGSTNVARVMGFRWGLVTAAIDISKGMAAVWFAQQLLPQMPMTASVIAAVAAVAGHNWSVFATGFYTHYNKQFRIRGGKGAATAFGTMVMMMPPEPIVLLLVIGIALALATRYASLAVLVSFAVGLSSTLVWALIHVEEYNIYIPYVLLIALLIVWRFRENIQRLLAGQERKLGERIA